MSFLKKIWRSIYQPRYFVGTDLEGNRFFEYPSLGHDRIRTRRRVRYEDMSDYIGGARRLPVQWVSWLSHTRADPPTLEELRVDLERQKRVLHNAAIIQARDQEERTRISAAETPGADKNPFPSIPQEIRGGKQGPSLCSSDGFKRPPPSTELRDVKYASQSSHSELSPIGKDKDWQPEAWTPRTTRKRGG